MSYSYGKDVTADVAAGDLDINDKIQTGVAGYNFIPQAVLINNSADDTDEYKTIVGRLLANNAVVTLRLHCGEVHEIALGKIIKTGTTPNTITILGNR